MDGSNDGITEERAEQVDRNIELGFGFARDVLTNPRLLDLIPDRASLVFGEVTIAGQGLRLVAYPAPVAGWQARVTGPVGEAANVSGRGKVEERSRPGEEGNPAGIDPEAPSAVGRGVSAEAALTDLERRLRASTEREHGRRRSA
jgi:hypothetical protein